MIERITDATPEEQTRGHRFRYHLAAGFCLPDDRVLDAACGTGYGYEILEPYGVGYLGVDKIDRSQVQLPDHLSSAWTSWDPYRQVDLETWQPDFKFDVFIGFETIEHLNDYSNYLRVATQARSWVLLSTPVTPTVGINPYHRWDFARGQLVDLFQDPGWELFQLVDQPSEQSEIYVFRRRS